MRYPFFGTRTDLNCSHALGTAHHGYPSKYIIAIQRSNGRINGMSPSIFFFLFSLQAIIGTHPGLSPQQPNEEEVASRCETVLNTTMAAIETYHTQKVEDFASLAKEHLDGEIELYEQVSLKRVFFFFSFLELWFCDPFIFRHVAPWFLLFSFPFPFSSFF